jgi:hypothetical protein
VAEFPCKRDALTAAPSAQPIHLQALAEMLEMFRHKTNGTYYGIKKHGGKRKEHSLDTTERNWLSES